MVQSQRRRKEEENFFKSLYKSSNNNIETIDSEAFFKNEAIKPLSDESADLCEGRISKKECRKVLKEMQNGKSPGSDGLLLSSTKPSEKKLVTM